MSEDQKLPIPGPAAVVSQPEAVVPVAPVATGTEAHVEPSQKLFHQPAGLEVMQGVVPPNHAAAVEHGAIEQFPQVASLKGNIIKFNLPIGVTEDNVGQVSRGNAGDGDADAARVARRQLERAA